MTDLRRAMALLDLDRRRVLISIATSPWTTPAGLALTAVILAGAGRNLRRARAAGPPGGSAGESG